MVYGDIPDILLIDKTAFEAPLYRRGVVKFRVKFGKAFTCTCFEAITSQLLLSITVT